MKKIISILMSAVMLFTLVIPAFAAETEDEIPAFTREEALDILGLTEEEAEGVTFYELSPTGDVVRSIPSEINSGEVVYEDLSVSSSFTGAAHKLNGTKFAWGVRIYSGNKQLLIGQYSYNSSWTFNGVSYNNITDGDTYTSGWMNIEYGQYYYLKYYFNYNNYEETIPFSIRIVMAVY